MYDVLCLGTLTSCDIIFTGLPEIPKEGTEILCKDLQVRAGGSANTPMALARLGVSAALLTRLGNDLFGRITFDMMQRTGMDTSEVIVDDAYRTCVSAALSTRENRGFATYYDNSKRISDQDIERTISECKVVFSDIGTCLELPVIVESVKKYKKRLMIDTGWLDHMDLGRIGHILDVAEVFSPNDHEACRIVGTEDVEQALAVLSGYVEVAIVKLGKGGSKAKAGGRTYYAPARTEFEEIDTTGAGDVFNAGFLYGYLKGWDVERCLKMGNLTGGFSIQSVGGVDDRFCMENLESFIKEI